jgi:hypothetical protein
MTDGQLLCISEDCRQRQKKVRQIRGDNLNKIIMKDQVTVSKNFRTIMVLLICFGAAAFIYGLFVDRQVAWANYLIVNYYFLTLSIGGASFYVIQSITQSGWSAAFKRVPEAMMSYIPFSAVSFLILYFGMKDLYPWADKELVAADALLQHKAVVLNIPFFFTRMIIWFILWIIFCRKLRILSLREDHADAGDTDGIMSLFASSELYSKILIFILVISFSFASFDWIMSIDEKWYSTIFALKDLVGAFLHGVSVLALIVFILYKRGYFPFLNKYHLHDFARYIFMLSIIWGYFWFAQFMLIWYGNIPAETVYYYIRWQQGWKIMFFLEIALNWGIPFLLLLPVKTSRNMFTILVVIIFLIIGQYISVFLQVIPGTTGELKFGLVEAGMFIGYAAFFALVIVNSLGRAGIIPVNHPYLDESLNHSFR